MVCVKRRQANIWFLSGAGSRSMDGFYPGSQDQGWVKTNCFGILQVCVWRGDVSTACAKVWDIVVLR